MPLLLSGCIKFDISTGIDENYTAFLSYNIELDVSDFDARYRDRLTNALNRIGWHYQQELGFIVDLDIENNPCRLTMIKRVENSSFEQAFASLEGLLKNEEITPFLQVDMAFNKTERQNRFILSAETDIPHIMGLSNAEELSPALYEQLKNAMETGEGTITVILPSSDTSIHSHPVNMYYDQVVMDVPLSYTGRTDFELAGTLNLLADGTHGGPLYIITHDLTRFRNLSVIISCAILIILLIVLLLKKLSQSKR